MGVYKICEHKGKLRDRCEHAWWGSFRGIRVSLSKWTNQEIRSKTEAYAALDLLRTAIRAGTFDPRGITPVREVSAITFRELAGLYKERHVIAKGLASAKSIDWRLKPLLAWFGDKRIALINVGDIEDFIADLRRKPVRGRASERTLAPSSVNRTIELVRHMLNWAVDREYIDRTPFRRGGSALIKKLREDNKRRRRVSEQEEARLLEAAPPLLRGMIIAALDTGVRRGEMLALRFTDLDLTRGLITLRGETTKSGKTRVVPIATARLRAVLDWLRLDPEGDSKPEETPVFSDEIGQPVGSLRTSWVNTVLRAHGIAVRWDRRGNYREPTPECLDAFRKIDLHWHDLRHEYASRLVEKGVPLAQVRDLLGHASITTTERYDNQTVAALRAAAARLEAGKAFQPSETGQFQDSFKRAAEGDQADHTAIEPNELENLDLENWLGGRDSNPDNVVQSHVSYR